IHRRLMGSSEKNTWTGRTRWGKGKYFMGSAWYYVMAVGVYRMFERPFVIGGLGIIWGYLKAALAREPRFGNLEVRRWLRRYELQSLFKGKRGATQSLNAEIRKNRKENHGQVASIG
ncbi:MAG: glycosyl transferase family 2, partial [Planctomycetota bacterium]